LGVGGGGGEQGFGHGRVHPGAVQQIERDGAEFAGEEFAEALERGLDTVQFVRRQAVAIACQQNVGLR
jgi:hypothetical protein